jgi:peroxiredoxin
MVPLRTSAPDFELPDTDGNMVSLSMFKGRPLLVMFICNHCPYVKHVAAELARIGRDYADKVGIVAINSNDPAGYPEDSPQMMKRERLSRGYTFPYLFDETQDVARSYDAVCTPDFYLFDASHSLVYRGQLDESRPSGNVPVTGSALRAAMDAVLSGVPVNRAQAPSIGCSIKWRHQ